MDDMSGGKSCLGAVQGRPLYDAPQPADDVKPRQDWR
jgi:hypothetical protein